MPVPKTNEDSKLQSVNGNTTDMTDIDMSKMKNIEPKLIETIMSEVSSRFEISNNDRINVYDLLF